MDAAGSSLAASVRPHPGAAVFRRRFVFADRHFRRWRGELDHQRTSGGAGNVQPSLVRKRDGTLAAYMRDNGPAPKRVPMSTSHDDGITWSPVVDTDIPNPGTSIEAIALRDGRWVMVYNDVERGRHSLAVSLFFPTTKARRGRNAPPGSRSARRRSRIVPLSSL